MKNRKIAILGDTHFGCRNDHPVIAENTSLFFKEVFFPYLVQNDIQAVVQLGDLVDRRKFINFQTLHNLYKDLLLPCEENKIMLYAFPGNHDLPLKNSVKHNSISTLFSPPNTMPKTLRWVDEVCKLHICNYDQQPISKTPVVMVPWICEENKKQTLEALRQKGPPTFVFGHFELDGFEMYTNQICKMGEFQTSMFRSEDFVFSGHFHKRHQRGQVLYVGIPYQMLWNDADQTKGFHTLDMESGEVEFIENPNNIFLKINYNDETTEFKKWIKGYNFKQARNKYIKVVVASKTNTKVFEKFVQNLENSGALDVQIIEQDPLLAVEQQTQPGNYANVELVDIITQVFENSQINVSEHRKQVLFEKITSLYNRALVQTTDD